MALLVDIFSSLNNRNVHNFNTVSGDEISVSLTKEKWSSVMHEKALHTLKEQLN